MYDFNPLSSLFLLRALGDDIPLPPIRPLLARLLSRLRRYRAATPAAATPLKRPPFERAFPAPRPAYNLAAPADADVPARP